MIALKIKDTKVGAGLLSEGLTLGESDRGHLGVDGVENALIPDLGLGDQADLGAQVGNSSSGPRHGQLYEDVI